MKKQLFIACLAVAIVALNCASSSFAKTRTTTNNPHAAVTDKAKVAMLTSLKDLDGTGRILEVNYTLDYKLDAALEAEIKDGAAVLDFLNQNLFDVKIPMPAAGGINAGCSAFAATELATGDYLMGRNYDYCHKKNGVEEPLTALVVKTGFDGKNQSQKKVVGVCDTYWLGYKKGFYNDGVSDLSALMGAPFYLMDGINEDGLAIGVLHLGGKPGMQEEPGKKDITTTVAMRLVLDRCSDVSSAIDTLRSYNMKMGSDRVSGSFHFFMADAKGHYAIVEYVYDPQKKGDYPSLMVPMADKDEYRCVTNFYVHPSFALDKKNGAASGGSKMFRYNILQQKLQLNVYKLGYEEAMQLLGCVATNANVNEPTSHTQWSSLYNLSRKTLDIAILKNYTKRYVYSVEKLL